MATTGQVLSTLFGAFNQADNQARANIYISVLKDVPPVVLEKAVAKVLEEWEQTLLPPPAVILKAAQSYMGSIKPETRIKTWDEAWNEINRAMYDTPWGKEPKFSTSEITEAVRSFGWESLHTSLATEMDTKRAQLRRIYEDVCTRTQSEARNEYLQGKNPRGVLGIPTAVKQLAEVMGK